MLLQTYKDYGLLMPDTDCFATLAMTDYMLLNITAQPQAVPLLRFFISMIKISIFKFQRKAEVN